MRDLIAVNGKPDAIGVEDYLNPAAQRSADAAITALELRGALEAIAACYGLPVYEARADTVRVHFCGQKSATKATRGGPPKTSRQRDEERLATKRMVNRQAVLMRYLPADNLDYDKADACALFDYLSVVQFKCRPRLVMR
jgi:hypothetical protein